MGFSCCEVVFVLEIEFSCCKMVFELEMGVFMSLDGVWVRNGVFVL